MGAPFPFQHLRTLFTLFLVGASTSLASQQNSSFRFDAPREYIRVSESGDPVVPKNERARYSKRTVNPACREARISHLEFTDVDGYRPSTNYCLIEEEQLPRDVRELLVRVRELNRLVSLFLEIPLEQLILRDFKIEFVSGRFGTVGARASEGGALGLMLTTYPNWSMKDFADDVYIHELFHLLVAQGGRVSEALNGLEEHPFLIESLPDVLVTEIKGSSKITADSSRLPGCLAELRDGTPIQSMNRSYRDFYPFRDLERIQSCCERLLPSERTTEADVLCQTQVEHLRIRKDAAERFAENYGLQRTDYQPMTLASPFQAENCRVRTSSGQTWITNCDTHEFAPVLISFFRTLREKTGHSHFQSWLRHLEKRQKTVIQWNCKYQKGTRELGGSSVQISRRPLLGEWVSYRDSLPPQEQSLFDRAWTAHALSRMVDLDEMYVSDTIDSAAQLLLKEKNPLFSDQNQCKNLYDFDPEVCSVICQKSS